MRRPDAVLEIVSKHHSTFMWADVQKVLHRYVDELPLFQRLDGMNPNNPTYTTNIGKNRLGLFELPHNAMINDGVIFMNNIAKGLVLGENFKRLDVSSIF